MRKLRWTVTGELADTPQNSGITSNALHAEHSEKAMDGIIS